MAEKDELIAISVGNTRTRIGHFVGRQLVAPESIPNDDLPAIVEHVASRPGQDGDEPAPIVLASVNAAVAERLISMLEDQLSREVFEVGSDLPVPVAERLDPETITGIDRLLNAAAAYETIQQACIIVDAGTAITVDFVDGEGTFHGGSIAPGAQLQLRAMHEYTAALPEIEFRRPDPDAFGRSTTQAMLHGVFDGIRGMVWRLVERYAEQYGAYPMVVATGGDARVLFEDDELIDRVVPDLTLLGIRAAVQHALRATDVDADPGS